MTRYSVRTVVTAGIASLVCVAAPGLSPRIAAQPLEEAEAAEKPPLIIERVLLKVNGEILTQTGLESKQIQEIRRRGLQPANNIELSQIISELTPAIISDEVDELLLVQRGKEMGWRISDGQFEEIVENLKAENDIESDEALAAALMEAEGMSMEDLRVRMERQMLVSQVQQMEVLSKVNMTDTEAREYYDSHLEEFTDPARASVREILVVLPEGSSGGISAEEQAKTVAQTAAARVRSGEDFATVAAEVSDSPSKANGGLIGPLLVEDYSDSFQVLIRELDPGEVSDPIRTPRGFQIIMLEERIEAVVQPFDRFSETIKNNVFGERRNAELKKFLDELRSEAVIEWKNEDLRLAYERHQQTKGSAASPF
jgi:parvulin-like peptidyl-prolyl isomerase